MKKILHIVGTPLRLLSKLSILGKLIPLPIILLAVLIAFLVLLPTLIALKTINLRLAQIEAVLVNQPAPVFLQMVQPTPSPLVIPSPVRTFNASSSARVINGH